MHLPMQAQPVQRALLVYAGASRGNGPANTANGLFASSNGVVVSEHGIEASQWWKSLIDVATKIPWGNIF
jgi:hypothetical protein